MNKILLASIIILATAFIKNATAESFKGAYVGAQTALVVSDTKTSVANEKSVNIANSAGATTNTTTNSKGLGYGIFGGYGVTMNDIYYVGGEASILSDTVNRKGNQNVTDSGNNASYNNNVTYKRGIAIGVAPRLGYVFGNNMLYAKPGVEISKDKATAVVSAAPSGSSTMSSSTVSTSKRNVVLVPAVGYEKALGPLLLRTEYTYNRGKKLGINSNSAPVTELGNVSYKDHRLAIGAAYKF
ncbi:MAG: hypothetical protein V4544_07590 [Pseudomonadota bacterium]